LINTKNAFEKSFFSSFPPRSETEGEEQVAKATTENPWVYSE